jgi:hypothetical protein
LRPVAATLDRLQTAGLTHRAIRVTNLLRSRSGDGVVLGPAWSAPPGCFQPALYEPPHVAMCHKAGRGDGRIAGDVYVLGVVPAAIALPDPLAPLSWRDVTLWPAGRGRPRSDRCRCRRLHGCAPGPAHRPGCGGDR